MTAGTGSAPSGKGGTVAMRGGAIRLFGSGCGARRIMLTEGLWTVELSVRNNQDRSFGTTTDGGFEVEVHSTARPEVGPTVLADRTGVSWSGAVPLRVGGDAEDTAPGKQIVCVDASGDWEIIFRAESGRDPGISADGSGRLALNGHGTATQRITLDSGLWTVIVRVFDNGDPDLDETEGGIPETFAVKVQSIAGGFASTLIDKLVARWSGVKTVRVTSGAFVELRPGVQIVSVDATGSWELVFQRE